ncbi:hypothetical protein GC088_02180 [Arthrobacter sp. JZ12]|uniref:SRPBCC domain-containing protein n=1 Tax=Arthrobacter sp. JZ12 TaxID=2654190 RepID=UPI002B4733EA|nr:SRPBCC domain-containing protein [Arthrobacter sp. JZ12]WRH24029.1 hypothetical protein GC088_02180 [Arthrobacter sp. JZ12]
MDSIFSHAEHSIDRTETALPKVISSEVVVPHSAAHAFAGFTDGIHLWWPAEQTKFGEGTHPEFTGGELFEEDPEGRTALWATLVPTEDDSVLTLTWHLDGKPHSSTRVTVSFTSESAGTRVRVVHDSWSAGTAGQEQFAAAPDWDQALQRYQRFMGG